MWKVRDQGGFRLRLSHGTPVPVLLWQPVSKQCWESQQRSEGIKPVLIKPRKLSLLVWASSTESGTWPVVIWALGPHIHDGCRSFSCCRMSRGWGGSLRANLPGIVPLVDLGSCPSLPKSLIEMKRVETPVSALPWARTALTQCAST